MHWTPDRLPDLRGKTFVITGGNTGLGLEACRLLVGKGGRVVFTARSETKAMAALETLRATSQNAAVDFVLLDLADLASVERAAAALLEKCPRIDALINNAGIMQPPLLRTKQGFELQFGTNHLGHFRLNALLLERLETSGGRFVPVSSVTHEQGRLDLADLDFERRPYDPTVAYSQSKLANLMYGLELQRRLAARGSAAVAIVCHPGYAATNLQSAGVGMEGGSRMLRLVYSVMNPLLAQPARLGAWSLVLAAADPDAKAGAYYGPTGMGRLRGPVAECPMAPQARDEAMAAKLWDASEARVGPFFVAERAKRPA